MLGCCRHCRGREIHRTLPLLQRTCSRRGGACEATRDEAPGCSSSKSLRPWTPSNDVCGETGTDSASCPVSPDKPSIEWGRESGTKVLATGISFPDGEDATGVVSYEAYGTELCDSSGEPSSLSLFPGIFSHSAAAARPCRRMRDLARYLGSGCLSCRSGMATLPWAIAQREIGHKTLYRSASLDTMVLRVGILCGHHA